jgi:type I restriction enzyme M protein
VVLFFEKGSATKKVWYYQLNLDRNLGKTNALSERDLADFIELQKTKKDSENSWTIDIKKVDTKFYDLSCKNPNKKDEVVLRSPEEILGEIEMLDEETNDILTQIRELI